MRKTVYLHIGAPKTGTTSLQTFLGKHRSDLARQGFFVPRSDSKIFGHHSLVLSLINDFCSIWYAGWERVTQDSKTVWSDLLMQIDKTECQNIIISSEMFYEITNPQYRSCSQDMGELIKRYLSAYDVRVIAYLRPTEKYLNSIYRQDLQSSPTDLSFAENVRNFKDKRLTHLHQSTAIDFYTSLFGKESIIIKKYDRKMFRDENVIFDFIDTIGIKYSATEESGFIFNENPSIDENYLEFKRALNIGGTREQELNTEISRIFIRASETIKQNTSTELWEEISSIIRNEHKIIKERYGVDLGSDTKLEDTNKPNGSFYEHLTLALAGLIINRTAETHRETAETRQKTAEINRETTEIQRKIDDLQRNAFNNLILPHIRRMTPAVVYPAGAHATWLMQNTILSSANIIACVDRNPKKHDTASFNAPIITPTEIPKYNPGVVFIASPQYGQEILDSLLRTLPSTTEIVFLS